jgi:hypothetical protein
MTDQSTNYRTERPERGDSGAAGGDPGGVRHDPGYGR